VVGVTYNSCTVRGLGEIAHTALGPTYVGPFIGSVLDHGTTVADVLRVGGFEAKETAGIVTEIWKKLILNAATLPTSALNGLNAAALGEEGVMRDLVDVTAREAALVARARGCEIDTEERIAFIHTLLMNAGPGKVSMLQDFEAGRQTEVDVINGAVVRAADDLGIAVPVNRTFVALVKSWERARGLGGGP
jgi:2-dehydropantoate 2-reductase